MTGTGSGNGSEADRRREARWQVALVVALVTCLLAVALGLPSLFFLAIVALGFVLAGELSGTPTIGVDDGAAGAEAGGAETDGTDGAIDETDGTDRTDGANGGENGGDASDTASTGDDPLRLERTLEETRVRPGQSVTVTIRVSNDSERVLPDVRVADEPPADVPVIDGSPAFATAVRPGETVTHEYELAPPRGEYAFGSLTVRARSLPATAVATVERDPAGDTEFVCETLLDAFPFRDQTIQFVGQAPTDDGGSGIEFFSTRSYRRGDPINRIDWHRFARTRELTTIEYREERSVTVVFVIDDRPAAHRERLDGGPDSFDLTLYAASRGIVASLEEGNRTGLATLSGGDWVEPGAGDGVQRRAEDALDDARAEIDRTDTSASLGGADRTERAGAPVADGGRTRTLVTELERRLPDRAQLAFCTPLLDDAAVDLVETLRTRDRAVTVVSPDVTADGGTGSSTTGARVVGLERANRIDALRGVGATVVDWDLAEPVSVALARAFRARGGSGGSGGGSV